LLRVGAGSVLLLMKFLMLSEVQPCQLLAAGVPVVVNQRVNFDEDATRCIMEDDEDKDPGDVFAIPDLYAPSRWLSGGFQTAGYLFAELQLDGLYPSS
jgi:hypothetical protein